MLAVLVINDRIKMDGLDAMLSHNQDGVPKIEISF